MHEKEPSSFSRKLLWLPNLLYTLAFSLFVLSKHPTPQHPTPPEHNPNDARNRSENIPGGPVRVIVESLPPTPPPTEEQKAEKKRNNLFKWGMAILEILAFFALAAYVSETRRTNNLTEQALNNSKEQFRQDQRPYVWLANPTSKDNPTITMEIYKPKNQIAATMFFTNFGKSPAIPIRHYHGMALGNDKMTEGPPKQWVESKGVLPNGKVDFFSVVSNQLTDEQISQYMSVSGAIMIYATWQYADYSGHKYETQICFGRLNLGGWAYCKEHNEIKDCAEKTCEP
jgi:hypothetical protein